MYSQASGPGKTSPRLYHDFLLLDPLKGNQKFNVLTNHAPEYEDIVSSLPADSCKHDYTYKSKQSITPPLDLRPDGTTFYKLAVVCKKCRIHADIRIDYRETNSPCPNPENALHHFQRLESLDVANIALLRFGWQCSSRDCNAVLTVSYRQKRLNDSRVDLLTNKSLLKKRYEELVADDPEREGIREARDWEALGRLRKYISDALRPEHSRRNFPANNKRFMEAFGVYGEDCKEILEWLGFTYAADECTWTLPNPHPVGDRKSADSSSQRELLEDVEIELYALLGDFTKAANMPNPAAVEGWPSAMKEIERTLAAQGYQRAFSPRGKQARDPKEPYYASLGALPDFSDTLIDFAHERQVNCSPEQQAYYLECLQQISSSRGSEALHIKCATLESQGLISRRDLNEAYNALNIPRATAHEYTDDRILGLFQARTSDCSPAIVESLRKSINIIGTSRDSQKLKDAAKDTVETYEEAINWLANGTTKDSPDDFILTAYAIKVADYPGTEEKTRKAVKIIADIRNSDQLMRWYSGDSSSPAMSVDEALRHLNVTMKLQDLDQTMLPMMFDSARMDRPGEQTDKAIQAIQDALRDNSTFTDAHSPETWPVGLISHGNTCYLNSILQYYYSIKPLRDIVLDYDNYKLDVTTEQTKKERVGQRVLELAEIKGGQMFAEDLKDLFIQMAKSPDSAVKPEQDLVCRAFLDPKDSHLYQGTREQYAITEHENVITEEGENATAEPESMGDIQKTVKVEQTVEVNNSQTNTQEEDLMQMDDPAEPAQLGREPSSASSATLNGEAEPKPQQEPQDVPMQSTEMPPTPPSSPGAGSKTQPAHAPPLPPRLRKFSTTTQTALNKAEDAARMQQDVTEVHDSIMFRLRAGMTPAGADAKGEQQDALRNLFSFTVSETTVKDDVKDKTTEVDDNNIQLNVPYEATDIYSALDAIFDLQSVHEGQASEQYKSLQTLPPILQINIPRIGFNKVTKESFKSDKCVKLEETLCLDPYYDASSDGTLARRKRCWGWRKRLNALEQEKKSLATTAPNTDIDGPTATEESAKYLSNLSDINTDLASLDLEPIESDSNLTSILSKDSAEQSARLTELSAEATELQKNLLGAFDDLQNLKYRLHAVFLHRGNTGHGHYWLYIRDPAAKDGEGMWRKYNDENVEEFKDMGAIYQASGWEQGTPTYAVYVREEGREGLVEPVCRNPVKAEGAGGDVSMGGVGTDEEIPGLIEQTEIAGGDTVMDESEPATAAAAGEWTTETKRRESDFAW